MDTLTKGKKVACPRSWDNAGLLTDFEVHYEHPDKLINGICRKCHAKLLKTHKGFLNGKIERPAEMTVHRHELMPEADHVGSVAPGVVEPVTDFDFDTICESERDLDEALGLVVKATPDARREAADVLHRVFQWCYPRNGKTDLRTAAARLAALVSGISPDVLDGKTLGEMATELGRTKAALSKTNVHAERHFGIHFPRSRSDTSRARMAAAQLGHKPTNTKRNGTPGGRALTTPGRRSPKKCVF